MPASKAKRKPMPAARRRRKEPHVSSTRRLPPIVDYSDVVTDEHLKRIRELVNQDDFKDDEVVSESGW